MNIPQFAHAQFKSVDKTEFFKYCYGGELISINPHTDCISKWFSLSFCKWHFQCATRFSPWPYI